MLAVATVTTHLDVVDLNDGIISLREAIFAANTLAGADTIEFDASLSGSTITLGGAELLITDEVSIDATDLDDLIVIDANEESRIFNIDDPTTANESFNVSLSGLRLVSGRTTGDNGDFSDSTYSGGAIRSLTSGDLAIHHSSIRSSTTQGDYARGGGIRSFGDVTLVQSTVSGNTTVDRFARGGGIHSSYRLTIDHSTIADNHALNSDGGGIINYHNFIEISSSIIAQNTAGGEGPDLASGSAVIILDHSLIGDNQGTSLAESQSPDVNGNLIGNSAGGGVIDASLESLRDNGGPTLTHALSAGSAAIDAGDSAFVEFPAYDQRSFAYSRVVGGRIDMGAFEFGATSADFDEDGDIDGLDFLAWQRGFGTAAPDVLKADGDADNDLDVDADDLAAWENAYGAQEELSAISSQRSASNQIAGRAVRSPGTASALSARLVDLALAADGTEETDGTYMELTENGVAAQDLRAPAVTQRGAAARPAVAEFGDIAVSRPAGHDLCAVEATVEDDPVFSAL